MTDTGIPTLYIVGTAEREVTPDRVEVTLSIDTPLHAESAPALADAARMRSRVTDAMRVQFPDLGMVDRRVTVQEVTRRVERRTALGEVETHYERRGFTGHCAVVLGAGVERAAEIVAHAGAHPDVARFHAAFTLSDELRRSAQLELEADAVRDGLDRAAGLAAAAGGRVAEVISIGEWRRGADHGAGSGRWDAVYSLSDSNRSLADDIHDELGELVPEPVRRSASMPMRVALAFT